jgi:hypothetical protein
MMVSASALPRGDNLKKQPDRFFDPAERDRLIQSPLKASLAG